MSTSKEQRAAFARHVAELLEPLGGVQVRSMFGGYGVYRDGVMFALLADDTLYLRVDEQTAPRFDAAKLPPFVYTSPKGASATMPYRQAPEAGLDDGELLCEWARGAFDAAVRARAKKPAANKPAAKKPAANKPAAKKPAQRGRAR